MVGKKYSDAWLRMYRARWGKPYRGKKKAKGKGKRKVEDKVVNLPLRQNRKQRRLAYALTFSKAWKGKKVQFGKGKPVSLAEARRRILQELKRSA